MLEQCLHRSRIPAPRQMHCDTASVAPSAPTPSPRIAGGYPCSKTRWRERWPRSRRRNCRRITQESPVVWGGEHVPPLPPPSPPTILASDDVLRSDSGWVLRMVPSPGRIGCQGRNDRSRVRERECHGLRTIGEGTTRSRFGGTKSRTEGRIPHREMTSLARSSQQKAGPTQ